MDMSLVPTLDQPDARERLVPIARRVSCGSINAPPPAPTTTTASPQNVACRTRRRRGSAVRLLSHLQSNGGDNGSARHACLTSRLPPHAMHMQSAQGCGVMYAESLPSVWNSRWIGLAQSSLHVDFSTVSTSTSATLTFHLALRPTKGLHYFSP